MKLDSVGTTFTRNQEQFSLKAYQDQIGRWTIGWGFTFNPLTGVNVKEGDVITQEEADEWWETLIESVEEEVTTDLQPAIDAGYVSQNLFNGCVDMAWNVGEGGFAGSSLVKSINNQVQIYNYYNGHGGVGPLMRSYLQDALSYRFMLWDEAGGYINTDLVQRCKDRVKLAFS